MALPIFDNAEAVPEAFRPEYEEREGKWHPKPSPLETALADERTKREAAEKLTKKIGTELEAAKLKAKANEAGITDEQLQKIRTEVRAEVETEVAPIRTDAEKLKAENRQLRLVDVVKKQAGDKGFLPTRLDDFWKLHGDEFDLTTDGKPMIKAAPGTDVGKHLEGLAKARPEWVQGTKANGGGAQGQQNGAAKGDDMMALPPEQRLAAAHAAGATE